MNALRYRLYESIHNIYHLIAKKVRKYDFDVDYKTQQTINKQMGAVIFACNHSNSHDFYTIQEAFEKNVIIFAASDGLDTITRFLFELVGTVLIDRSDKKSCSMGTKKLIEHLSNNKSIIMYPEGTWNVHPTKLMLPMKLGVIRVAAESGKPIIPVIFDYVERMDYCTSEMDTIEKCVVRFGQPIFVERQDDFLEKLEFLKDQMATIRWNIWEQQGLFDRANFDQNIFINHDCLKCDDGMFGFKYDWKKEEKFIFGYNDYIYQNYPINRVIM